MKLFLPSARLLAVILSVSTLLMTERARSYESPELGKNPSPKDRIEVTGTVPDKVTVEVETTWETTASLPECRYTVPMVGSFPNVVHIPVQLKFQVGHQWNWTVWRDYFQPDKCGWQLREILAHADNNTASGLLASRPSNIPSRIAYVCRDNDNCENGVLTNDDSSKPIYLYCKFSVIHNLPNTDARIKRAMNPCAFGRREHRGPDGKFEHYLRPDQHRIGFIINDLESH